MRDKVDEWEKWHFFWCMNGDALIIRFGKKFITRIGLYIRVIKFLQNYRSYTWHRLRNVIVINRHDGLSPHITVIRHWRERVKLWRREKIIWNYEHETEILDEYKVCMLITLLIHSSFFATLFLIHNPLDPLVMYSYPYFTFCLLNFQFFFKKNKMVLLYNWGWNIWFMLENLVKVAFLFCHVLYSTLGQWYMHLI